MSSSFISTLSYISQQVVTYMGTFNVIAGSLGGLLNIIVFLSLKTFRQNSCALYLTVMSFVNVGQLLTGELSRVMITVFGIDWTQKSLIYCKFRSYGVNVFTFISFTYLCLATIDQFLATCVHVYWQQWSNIKLARYLCATLIPFWIIYGIPYIIFYDQVTSSTTGKLTCSNTNTIFKSYHTYMNNIILSGGLPTCITVLFGILAYRNVRQIAYRTVPLVRREMDKQLTNMVLVQVLFSFFVVSPYVIGSVLPTTTDINNDPDSAAQFSLAINVAACLNYLYFAVSVNQISNKLLNIFKLLTYF
jgi:hypothetical protein